MLEDFIEAGEPYSDDQLSKIGEVVGFEPAEGYKEFVRKYGNAFVGGLIDGSPELPVLGFFDLEKIISTLDFNAIYRENRVMPFADCELGNTWILGDDGSVSCVNFYDKPTATKEVSSSFSKFVSRIVIEDD